MASTSSHTKVIFVGGKGGVGKTTVASALALKLSESHKTLLISTDPAHSVSDTLHIPKTKSIQQKPNSISFDTWELHAEQEYEHFRDKHQEEFKLILDTSTYLDESDINQFLSLAIPGIDEIMGFKSIIDQWILAEYDYFVVDTAPTGHALRLLFIPELLDEWVKQLAALRWKYREIQKTFKGHYDPDAGDDILLDLKKSVLKMRGLISDPKLSEFIIVSKPEEVVVAESNKLYQSLRDHEISVKNIVINNVMKEKDDSAFCTAVKAHQATHLASLHKNFSKQNIIEIPMYPHAVSGIEQLERLSSQLKSIN